MTTNFIKMNKISVTFNKHNNTSFLLCLLNVDNTIFFTFLHFQCKHRLEANDVPFDIIRLKLTDIREIGNIDRPALYAET